MKLKAIIVSGYFNPIHKGHIELFHKAKSLGDKLFVILNNDNQRELKGSKEFMLEDERYIILEELKVTDKVFISIDNDRTVCKSIEKISKMSKLNYHNHHIIMAEKEEMVMSGLTQARQKKQ